MKVNWITQVVTMIGTLNTVAIAFGWYHLGNDDLQAVETGVSAILTVVGNILTHRKEGV